MKAWSYSGLSKYENCPRQFYYTKVAKTVVEPDTVHTIWGKEVHAALEFRVKDGTPLPEKMAKWEPIAAKFANAPGEVFTERQYAITRDMKQTEWDAADCWYRGIIDDGVDTGKVSVLGDYKTGKVKDDFDQMSLFAATHMTLHPEIEVSRAMYIWLAHNKVTRKDVKRDLVPVIWADFMVRSQRLEKAYEQDKWLPRPSGLCNGWCPVGRSNCEFWAPKKNR